VSYEYNKFHLLMDQRTTSSSGTLLQDAVQCYAINETGGKVCGDEALALKLSDLPAFYTLPVEQKVTYYTPVNIGKGLLKDMPTSRTVVTQKTYDDQGNVLSSTDASGRYSVTSYNPANQNGFINDRHEDIVYPTQPKSSALLAGVLLKSALKPDPIKTTYEYLKLAPLDSQLKADLSLPKQLQESYLDAQGHWQVFRTKDSDYYGQEVGGLRHAKAGQDPSYGLLSQAQLSEPATAPDRLSGQLQQYHYQTQDTINIHGKDYAVLEKQTAAYHHAPNQVGLGQSHPISVSKYVSLYTGHELLAKDANGNENAYLYDALGRKTQAIANLGSQLEATKTYQYHMGSGHNEVIVTAPNGYQSKQVYDGLGRVIGKYVEHINSNGQALKGQWDQVASTTYDQYGNKSSSTVYDTNGEGQPLSLTTYYQYDSQNRPTIESFPDGAAKVTVYDDAHNRTIRYILASNGKALKQGTSPCRIGDTYYQATIKNFTVVDRNNMTDKDHPHGKAIASYLIASNPAGTDAQGNALYDTTLKQALIHNEAFLAKGMVLDPSWLPSWIERVIDQHAYYSKSTTTYDGFGRAIASEDVNGHVTQQVFDARGNVTQKILPNGNTQVMGYDVAGKLVQIGAIVNGKTQNLGKRYYNALGDLVWEEDPLGNQRQYQQDANGNVTQITTPNGQVIHQQYDAMNKLIKRSVQGDSAGLYTTTWAYDAKTGKLTQRVDATGTTTFSYYPNGQIKSIAHSTENSKPGQVQPPYTLSYTYTLSGHPKSITDASGKTTSYHYNNLGQLTQVLYDGKLVNDYGYDHYARLISQTYPNHLQTQYTYDEYNALATLTHQQLGKTTKLITKFAYSYHQDGNIQTRTRSNQQGEQAKETYTYDKDNSLTSYQCQGSLCPQDQRHNTIHSQHYTFDAVNNIQRIESSLTNAQGKVTTNTTTYDYSPILPTRLIGYQNSDPDYGNSPMLLYDKDGNMTEDDQHQLLTYDALDRTQAIHKAGENTPLVTYLYNGDNIQIGTQSKDQDPTYFIYGQGKLTNTGQGNNTTSYLYGGKQRLAKVENQNTTYYLTDQGQSVIHLVQTRQDNQPKVIASYAYSPYGIETTLSQASKNQTTKRFGFDGQLTDPTTGWQFLGKGYRAYNPLLHRFMNQDSMSPFEKGGINGYVFANNNPIMQFDPSGHFAIGAIIGMIPIIGDVYTGITSAISGEWGWAAASVIDLALNIVGDEEVPLAEQAAGGLSEKGIIKSLNQFPSSHEIEDAALKIKHGIESDNISLLGEGMTAKVYLYKNSFVIKNTLASHDVVPDLYSPERASRILNLINGDDTFSKVIQTSGGDKYLVSRFIDGDPVMGKEAFDFVRTRSEDRTLLDHWVPNVLRSRKTGELYLIDPDYVLDPYNSVTSQEATRYFRSTGKPHHQAFLDMMEANDPLFPFSDTRPPGE